MISDTGILPLLAAQIYMRVLLQSRGSVLPVFQGPDGTTEDKTNITKMR